MANKAKMTHLLNQRRTGQETRNEYNENRSAGRN